MSDDPDLHRVRKVCRAVEDPLATYMRLLKQQIAIAADLERIADGLPDRVDAVLTARLWPQILPLLDVCVAIEQDVIYPRLLAWIESEPVTGIHFSAQTASRLTAERDMDVGYAIEVCDLLHAMNNGSRNFDSNASGYLLRSFFESIRRSASFGIEYLVPMARRALLKSDVHLIARLLDGERMVVAAPCAATWSDIKNAGLKSADIKSSTRLSDPRNP